MHSYYRLELRHIFSYNCEFPAKKKGANLFSLKSRGGDKNYKMPKIFRKMNKKSSKGILA